MIEVQDMVIRIPGIGQDEGHQIGQEISQRIAEGLKENQGNRTLTEMNLTIELPSGYVADDLAENISAQILYQLNAL